MTTERSGMTADDILADAKAVGLPSLRRQWSAGRPYRTIPGFTDSLRALLFTEGYSFTDIGLMFGMTREAVRSVAAGCGISWNGDDSVMRGLWPRRWDDEAHRFRPIPRAELDAMEQNERRAKRQQGRLDRHEEIVAAIRAAQAQQSEPLSIAQMARAAGYSGNERDSAPWLVSRWGRSLRVAGALAEIRQAAGLVPRARGAAGHLGGAKGPRTRQSNAQTEQRHRAVLAMRASGMKYREIAAVLGIPMGTAAGIVHAHREPVPHSPHSDTLRKP